MTTELICMAQNQNAYILFMSIELLVEESGSLKAKRRVVKSIISRLRNKFNISVSEVGYLDQWQRAMIALSMVCNDKKLTTQSAAAIENFLRESFEVQLLDINIEIF